MNKSDLISEIKKLQRWNHIGYYYNDTDEVGNVDCTYYGSEWKKDLNGPAVFLEQVLQLCDKLEE